MPITAVGYTNGQPTTITLVSIGDRHYLAPDAAEAWLTMVVDAAVDGVTFSINSSFRTMEQQKSLVSTLGRYKEGGLAATPGQSPHQRGIAVDVNVGSSGKGTPGTNKAWFWLVQNAWRYGFVCDYLVNGNESWHWEFEPQYASRYKPSNLGSFSPVYFRRRTA